MPGASLTRNEMGNLAAEIKRVKARCLQRGDVLGKWLEAHPHVDPIEARQFAMMVCRVPFPSIEGPKPKYRDRPFFDARREDVWKNDNP